MSCLRCSIQNQKNRRNRCIKGCGVILFANQNCVCTEKMSSFVEDFSHPGGPCIPGTHKLFVNVKGDFYPCEKVCECSADTIIGNIDKGFDLDKAETLLNVGKLTEEQCRDCWCAKYCYICTAHLDQGDGLSRELKQKHCAGVRKA